MHAGPVVTETYPVALDHVGAPQSGASAALFNSEKPSRRTRSSQGARIRRDRVRGATLDASTQAGELRPASRTGWAKLGIGG